MTKTRRPLAALAATALLCAGASAASAGTLYLSQDDNSNGLYTLDTTTGAATLVGASAVTSQTVGLSPGDTAGQLFGTTWTRLTRVNTDGSGATEIGGADAEGLAYDPTSGILYAAINGAFFTLDTSVGGTVTSLAAPGGDVEGLAYHNGGIFGLAAGGALRRYDISGGTWSLIGNTGVDFDQVGLAYDTELDILYGIGDQDSFLYAINPTTAAARRIGDTGLQDPGGGLAFIGGAVVPLPPAAWMGLGLLAGVGLLRRRRRRLA